MRNTCEHCACVFNQVAPDRKKGDQGYRKKCADDNSIRVIDQISAHLDQKHVDAEREDQAGVRSACSRETKLQLRIKFAADYHIDYAPQRCKREVDAGESDEPFAAVQSSYDGDGAQTSHQNFSPIQQVEPLQRRDHSPEYATDQRSSNVHAC